MNFNSIITNRSLDWDIYFHMLFKKESSDTFAVFLLLECNSCDQKTFNFQPFRPNFLNYTYKIEDL